MLDDLLWQVLQCYNITFLIQAKSFMRIIAKIFLFMMLVSQFVIATHAYEHDLHETETHQCDVCLKLNSNDDAATHGDYLIPINTIVDGELSVPANFHLSHLHHGIPIRSPPIS